MGKIEVFKKNIFDQIISDLYKNYEIEDEKAEGGDEIEGEDDLDF